MRSIVIVFEAMSALCAFTKQKKSVHPFASPSVWLSESSSAAPVKAYTTHSIVYVSWLLHRPRLGSLSSIAGGEVTGQCIVPPILGPDSIAVCRVCACTRKTSSSAASPTPNLLPPVLRLANTSGRPLFVRFTARSKQPTPHVSPGLPSVEHCQLPYAPGITAVSTSATAAATVAWWRTASPSTSLAAGRGPHALAAGAAGCAGVVMVSLTSSLRGFAGAEGPARGAG